MIIEGERIVLRAVEEDDLEMLRELINSKSVEYMVGTWNMPVSKDGQKKWFDNLENDKWKHLHAIIETFDGEAMGYLTLHDIDWKNRRAMYGMKTTNNRKVKGIGFETACTIMKYVFDELQLNKLEAEFIENNEASIHIHQNKCGWNVDGRRRKQYFQNGKYYDVIIMSVLKEEYIDFKNTLK